MKKLIECKNLLTPKSSSVEEKQIIFLNNLSRDFYSIPGIFVKKKKTFNIFKDIFLVELLEHH